MRGLRSFPQLWRVCLFVYVFPSLSLSVCLHSLFCNIKFFHLTFSGIFIGFILNFSTSGFICTIPVHNGWPFIMYIFSKTFTNFTLIVSKSTIFICQCKSFVMIFFLVVWVTMVTYCDLFSSVVVRPTSNVSASWGNIWTFSASSLNLLGLLWPNLVSRN